MSATESAAESATAPLPFSRPCIGEDAIAGVAAVLRSGWITSGPQVLAFEDAFRATTGAAHAIAVNSATTALDLIFAALDLQPGDEVISPALNWVSGPNMVELNGGTNVFADIEPGTLNLDVADVERLLSPRTRAVMPVHFAGAPVDLARLRALCAARGVLLIEDAAHAAGALWAGGAIGGDSDVAVFSFHPTKNLTTGEGGMITCRDAAFAERLRLRRFHGIRKDAWQNNQRSGRDGYEVLEPAGKANLPDLLAVLGVHQLRDLARMNAERARLAALYHAGWDGIRLATPLALPTRAGDVHAWHIFVVRLDLAWLGCDRAAVVDRLSRHGIGTGLHYPAVHTQRFYREKYGALSLPQAEAAGACVLSLPLFPGMTDADVARVLAALRSVQLELRP